MKKKIFVIMMVIMIIFSIAIYKLYSYYRFNIVSHPIKQDTGNVEVDVNVGESLYTVVDNMYKDNLVNSSLMIKIFIKNNKVNTNIRPGSYLFPSDVNLEDLIRNLNKGIYDKDTVMITIPEGFNIEQIGELLEKNGIISKDKFISSCKEYTLPEFIKKDNKRKYELEGYLFPDTYELKKNMDGNKIIELLLQRFANVIKEIESKNNLVIKDKLDSIIIMGSIVEKEVKNDDERAKAASVFYNRLNKGMKLESCATVLYALGYHKDKLLNKDLKIDSPYNTYIIKALPQGPICCPGKASILAALNPDKTNYLYFVSNNDGTHTFTNSYDVFLEVKQKTQGNN